MNEEKLGKNGRDQWFKIYVDNVYRESFRGSLDQTKTFASSSEFAKAFNVDSDAIIAVRYVVDCPLSAQYAREVLGAEWIKDDADLSLEVAKRRRDGIWVTE